MQTLTFNKDNWSGEMAEINVGDNMFDFQGETFRAKILPIEDEDLQEFLIAGISAYDSDGNKVASGLCHIDGTWVLTSPFVGDLYREDRNPFVAVAKILAMTM